MKNGIPLAYATFRVIWSAVHVALVAILLIVAIVWFFTDGQGVRLTGDILQGLGATQQAVARAIPFPWGG